MTERYCIQSLRYRLIQRRYLQPCSIYSPFFAPPLIKNGAPRIERLRNALFTLNRKTTNTPSRYSGMVKCVSLCPERGRRLTNALLPLLILCVVLQRQQQQPHTETPPPSRQPDALREQRVNHRQPTNICVEQTPSALVIEVVRSSLFFSLEVCSMIR